MGPGEQGPDSTMHRPRGLDELLPIWDSVSHDHGEGGDEGDPRTQCNTAAECKSTSLALVRY